MPAVQESVGRDAAVAGQKRAPCCWRNQTVPYALALVSVGVTLWMRNVFSPVFGPHTMLILLILPILAGAFAGGFGPGLLATVLAGVGVLVVTPVTLSDTSDMIQWTVLLATGVLISILCGLLRRSRSDAKKALSALKMSLDEQHHLLQNLAAAVVVHAPDTRILFSNPAAARLLGLTSEQMQGKQAIDPAWHFIHSDGATMKLEEYPVNRVLTTCQPLYGYIVGVHASEATAVTWVIVNAYPELSRDGSIRQVVVTFSDITAMKQAEDTLRENEAILSSFFNSPGMLRGIVELVDGDVLHIRDNAESAAFFGRTPSEMRRCKASAMGVPPEVIRLWTANYQASQQSGVPVTFNYEHKVKGVARWFAATVTYLGTLPSGAPRFSYSVADFTQIRQLETQLTQAQKMEAIGQLAGGVAHDFNNMLQAINGFAELAKGDLDASHPAVISINEIVQAGARAAKLVSQLLAFSRRQVLEPASLDMNLVVGNMVGMLERVIGEHVRLDFVPGYQLGTVRADRTMMEQVVLNLSVNARDAMPAGGSLTLELENVCVDGEFCRRNLWARPGRYVLLSVTDTGCGMDVETLDHVFEPFFTTKGPGKGTGLGLSMVYGIVRQHEGMIRVYSEVGKGTTFKVYLPIVERPVERVGNKIEGTPVGGTETILVAEDDPSLRELARQTLERAGYKVLLAADGAEAVALFTLNAGEVKLLLLDVVMPRVGGREAFEQIRAVSPSVPALFASGYSENAIHTNFILKEGTKLIRKPYGTNDLLRSVRDVLDSGSVA